MRNHNKLGGGEVAENSRDLNQKLGRAAIDETEQYNIDSETLNRVSESIRKLGEREENRTPEAFGRLVEAADLSPETKEQLLQEYQPGDDFSTLLDAMSARAGQGENSEGELLLQEKREKLKRRLKIFLRGTAMVVVVGAIFFGARALSRDGGNVALANPAPIENTGDAIKIADPEDGIIPEALEEETSILDAEYENANYENYDLAEIGEAVQERWLDTGEGYEVSENGVEANWSDYNDIANKSSKLAFGTGISEEATTALQNGDRSLYIDEMMTKFANNPAVAASYISVLEPAMEALNVPEEIRNIPSYGERAQAVWNWVRTEGGDTDEKVLGAMYVALKAETTEFEVNERTGTDWTMYEMAKGGGGINVDNATLVGQPRIERDAAIQVTMWVTHEDGAGGTAGDGGVTGATGNMGCGGQLTGPVVVINKITNEEIKRDLPVLEDDNSSDDEQKEQTTTPSDEEEKTTEEEETPREEEDESIKPKDADNLIQNVQDNLQEEGVNNPVTQTPNVVPESTMVPGQGGEYVPGYVVNDGTTVTVDENGQVTSVTDEKGTVEVESGITTPVGAVTGSPLGVITTTPESASTPEPVNTPEPPAVPDPVVVPEPVNTPAPVTTPPPITYSEQDYADAL